MPRPMTPARPGSGLNRTTIRATMARMVPVGSIFTTHPEIGPLCKPSATLAIGLEETTTDQFTLSIEGQDGNSEVANAQNHETFATYTSTGADHCRDFDRAKPAFSRRSLRFPR